MSKVRKIAKSTLVKDKAGSRQGSAHLLVEPIGPLSAGNDFNWWNLVIVEPGKSVHYVRQGCYGVYAVHGGGEVTYSGVSGRTLVERIVAKFEWSRPKGNESKMPGVFNIEIRNRSKTDLLVAFVLLAVDPGTTPGHGSSPRPSPKS